MPLDTSSTDEERRLVALLECHVLDTPRSATSTSSRGSPPASARHPRRWSASSIETDSGSSHASEWTLRRPPRDVSFCAHAILRHETMVVNDTLTDPRFRDSPLVTGAPQIRFYAGVPLRLSDGLVLGTLCVIDYQPRALSGEQLRDLEALARQAAAQLELRRTIDAQRTSEQSLRASERRLVEAQRVARIGSWEWDLATDVITWSDEHYRLFGVERDQFEPTFDRFVSGGSTTSGQ